MKNLEDRIASLSPEQRAVFEALRQAARKKEAAARPEPIPVREPGAPVPLSFDQERLWFISRLEPGASTYNIATVTRLAGALRFPPLLAAFGEIVRRHEAWRTTFPEVDGGPVQRIHPAAPVPVPTIDLRALPEARRDGLAMSLCRAEAFLPFDLTEGPLLRALLVRVRDEEVLCLLAVHHIIADWLSFLLFWRELATLYVAFAAGRPSPLPALPVQYGDFALWQRRRLAGETLERLLSFWTAELAGAPHVLEIPADRPRPAVQTMRGGMAPVRLPAALADALRSLGRQEGATSFITLLAAWSALLARYTGLPRILVGTPNANRNRSEIEPLFGFFVTQLVFATDVAGDPPLCELIRRARATALRAYAHQELPFGKLVEALKPERNLARAPLVQVNLQVLEAQPTTFELPGLTLTDVALDDGMSRFDMTLVLFDAADGIAGWFEYNRDLFDLTTVARMADAFHLLIEGAAAEPERPLAALPLFAAGARQQLLHEWADAPAASDDPAASLDELLFGGGAAAPDRAAPALVDGETTLTRGELAGRIGALARQLGGLGVGPGSRVAVCLPRSPEMVVAVLATLAAGAAYVPLDPAYPVERLEFMLADSAAAVLLTTAELAGRWPGFAGAVVAMGGDAPDTVAAEMPRPRQAPDPDDLAYICYTSGSTGRPKGVAMTRRALVHLLAWQAGALPRAARTLQLAPLSFDVSFQEIGSAWAAGGALVLVDEETRRDGAALLAHLERHRVERLFLPFVALAYLAEAAEAAPQLLHRLALRDGITAGEQLQVTGSVAAFFAGLPRCRLHNHYGPTETHVATAETLADDPAGWPLLPAIGRPIDGARALVLDAAGEPVPAGVSGELSLGGACLARGYWRRPERTAERFVPDPWGPPGSRLYHTGDRVRHLADGRLEYQGRIDHQVKIRGIRVEPGEVEAALAGLPGIARAAVVAREAPGGRLLAAFYVAADAASVEPADLAARLAARLPPALVPTRFVPLPELPTTPSGKVDRRALAHLPLADEEAAGFVPPHGGAEEALAEIWSELLGGVRVARGDDFFALGGHSLLATRLVARVRRAFGVELPQRAVFEDPTLAALAARLAVPAAPEEAGAEPPPPRAFAGGATPAGWEGGDPLEPPLSFAQERLWLIDRLEPASDAYHIPVALSLSGPLDRAALARAWSELAARHPSLRTRFGVREGVPWQRVEPAARVPVPCLDLSALPAAARELEADRLTDLAGRLPFDLERGPVLRVFLLALAPRDGRSGTAEHLLLFTVHHIAGDGWSNGVLVREMVALYEAFAAGRAAALPPLPLTYADYARWQRATVAGPRLAAMLEHFRRELYGVPPLELPADRPRLGPGAGGAIAHLTLAPAAVEPLRALGRQTGTTLFMALLAAFEAAVGRASGQRDFAVGTPVAGRRFVELEGMIGFFVNTLVLRADLSGGAEGPTGAELLARVRARALAAFAHQDLPFERLVSELNPERSLTRTPLFQVMCILQNAPAAPAAPAGLAIAFREPAVVTAKFDLTLSWAEADGGLAALLEYRPELFDRATVTRLSAAIAGALAGLAAAPERPLADLPLLAPAERQAVLAEWNDTAPAIAPRTLDEILFGAGAAALDPAAPALVDGETTWSRGELERRIGLLARHLRGLGVGPGSQVAVCLPRSPERVVAVLATLAAGAAYVPLDPAYPPANLEFMLADSAAAVLLTTAELAGRLPAFAGKVVEMGPETETAEGERPSAGGAGAPPDPDHLAYVCYTSGSTGRPKGVAMTRRALAHLLAWQAAALPGAARTLQFAPLSFDVSFQEIGSAWASGSVLVLVDEETRRDGAALLAHLERHRVERLFLPFVALAYLAEAAEAAPQLLQRLPLRDVITAGEQLQVTPSVAALLAGLPGCRLHNHYGPTETHVATADTLAGDPTGWPLLPSIGRPIDGARALVLDAAGGPVPVGAPGELSLGGACLARGYLGRPERTAERFVPDPWGPSGSRLYKTGDRARHLADGRLEYQGRTDHQVKIRGIRVEPGEVEAALAGLPGIARAAVVAREAPGGRILAAFYVAADAASVEPAGLAAQLAARLPPALVPTRFVPLPELPTTPSGKVDRRALARLPLAEEKPGFVPPRGQAEEILAGLWSELLGGIPVSRGDDFFALGGHSLLATRLVARVRRTFEVELPQRAVFEAPTLAALAARLVSPAARGEEPGTEPPPPRAFAGGASPAGWDGGDAALPPLSFSQERLWLIDRLEPGGNAYHVPQVLALSGPLHPAALDAAWSALVARHAALRTRYTVAGDEPRQLVLPPEPVPVPRLDLAALPPAVAAGEARRLAGLAARLPFDLERDLVLRVFLVALPPAGAAAEHRLLFTLHHIASDGWSGGILVREMVALYEALAAGRPAALPALPMSYADYARWQRATISGPRLAALLDFFRRELADLPALELPTDRPRGGALPGGAVEPLALSPAAVAALRALGRQTGTTLFMVLFAAFEMVLGRAAGQRDFAVGTPIAGRRHLELEGMIGFFVNTLVLRSDLAAGGDEATGAALLSRLRARALAVFAHQEMPFEKLVSELNPERSLSQGPLIQVMCGLQSAPDPPLEVAGLEVAVLPGTGGSAKLDLTLSWTELQGGLAAVLEFRPELFDRTTVRRLLGWTEAALAGLAAAPERPLGELALLAPAERQAVLVEWNDTALPGTEEPGLTLADLFERQAAATPDATALVEGMERLTYAELARRSGSLAARLWELGVRPEVRVAISLPRSVELVVAILAVTRAGGAFVTLDPAYPRERRSFLLADSGARLLIAPPGNGEAPSGLPADGIVLSPQAGGGRPFDPAAGPRAAPGNLAYVIYTSGSTGRPKGVAIEHRSVAALLAWGRQIFSAAELAGMVGQSAVSFDMWMFELFAPLTIGGRLILAAGLLELPALPAAGEATLVTAVPAVMAELLRGGGLPPSVSTVILGGEVLPRALADRVYAQPGVRRLVNGYGPTEDTTYSTTSEVPAADAAAVAIGRPLAGSRALLLDADLHPAPLGAPAELYLAGAGLARGYAGRPELTAERFVPDPLAAEPGARAYRTGDLARHRPSGEIEYLGRSDQQVKLRGVRIEPAEIEHILAGHPGVAGCAVVIAGESAAVGGRLVAFVAGRDGAAPSPLELLEFLEDRLPAPMLPSAFLAVTELPLSPNGKVDRRALRQLADEERAGRGFVPLEGESERRLAALWQDLLESGPVSADDDFFALGGHSLLAVQLVGRIDAELGIALPSAALFEHRRLRPLAAELDRRLAEREAGRHLDGLVDELAALSEQEVLALLAAHPAEDEP